jgi:hypothetical protein
MKKKFALAAKQASNREINAARIDGVTIDKVRINATRSSKQSISSDTWGGRTQAALPNVF